MLSFRLQSCPQGLSVVRACSSLICGLALVFLLTFSAQGSMDADSYTIGYMMSQSFPESYPSLFEATYISLIVNQLDEVACAVNWYLLFERSVVVASISYSVYLALLGKQPLLRWIIIVILVLLVPGALWQSNFTFVSALATASGAIGVLYAVFGRNADRRLSLMLVLGLLLTGVGFSIRPHVVLLASAPYCLFIGMILFLNRSELCSNASILKKVLWALLVPGVFCICLAWLSGALYQNEAFSSWASYNDLHAQLQDFTKVPYAAIAEQLSAIGVSENDYRLACLGMTLDLDYYTYELLDQIVHIVEEAREGQDAFMLIVGHYDLANWNHILLLAVLALTLVFVAAYGGPRALGVMFIFMVLACALSIYFVLGGRLPVRVEFSIWSLSIGFGLMGIFVGCGDRGERRADHVLGTVATCVGAGVLIFGLAVGLANFRGDLFRAFIDADAQMASSDIQQAIEADPEAIYLWSGSARAVKEGFFDYRYNPDERFTLHNLNGYGWTLGSPQWASVREKDGLSSSLRWLADDDRAVFVCANGAHTQELLTYIQEHYYPQAECEMMESYPDAFTGKTIELWRYSSGTEDAVG